MFGCRAIAFLLTIAVVLLGTTLATAPIRAGMDHGIEQAATQGTPNGCGDCDHGQPLVSMRCQLSCLGIAAVFPTAPVLRPSMAAPGWMPTADVRGSGRELAPDLPPPKPRCVA
jgi:hypothetical protein